MRAVAVAVLLAVAAIVVVKAASDVAAAAAAAAPCTPTADAPCEVGLAAGAASASASAGAETSAPAAAATAQKAAPRPGGEPTFTPPPLTALEHLNIFGSPYRLPGYTYVGPVQRMAWDHTRDARDFARELAAKRRPVILEDSPATRWAAFGAWQRDAYLTAHVPRLTKVYRHRARTFVYENENRRTVDALTGKLPFVVGPTNQQPVTMAMTEFLAEIAKPNPTATATAAGTAGDGFFHYYSREMRRADNFVSLLRDVSPYRFLSVGDAGTEQVLLWMGGNGTTAHPHYDTNVNFYFQIRGHKRFVLSPPSEYRALYPHPHLHACDRQSMLNFTHPNPTLFPLYGGARAFVADLSPGDLLLLPPLWFHKVTAKSASVSVNVWSDALENQIVIPLNTQAVPSFITARGLDTAAGAEADAVPHKDGTRMLVLYIRQLLQDVLGLHTPKERSAFIRDALLKTRYKPFAKHLGCDKKSFKPERCPKAGWVDPAVRAAHLDAPLATAVRLFGDAKATVAGSGPGALDLLVLDFLERLVFFHAGVEHVCAFFRCVALRDAWAPDVRPDAGAPVVASTGAAATAAPGDGAGGDAGADDADANANADPVATSNLAELDPAIAAYLQSVAPSDGAPQRLVLHDEETGKPRR